MAKKTAAKLKKELDSIFSKYIRLTYADKEGMVACYTCGKVAHYKQMQNGHFISRQYLATRFDEWNCRPQDVGCNIYGNGKQVEFARKLEIEKKGITLKLYKEAQKIVKNFPYEEKIIYYTEKVNVLKENKC